MSEHNYTVVLTATVGSRAYGLATDTSDTDKKSVAIPELKHYFGFNSTWTGTSSKTDKEEHTIYEISRFMHQCANASPESLDILFSPFTVPQRRIGFELLAIRDSFISKKCKHSYTGFAYAQLKKLRNKPNDPHAGKWAYHTVRLLHMAYEILNTGKINTDRTNIDKDVLMQYKTQWQPKQLPALETYVIYMETRINKAYEESDIPYSPNLKDLDEWLVGILQSHFAP